MIWKHSAVVIRIKTRQGLRYFRDFGKGGRLQSAWSLAGAQMFGPWATDLLEDAERRLKASGREPVRVIVGPLRVEGGAS